MAGRQVVLTADRSQLSNYRWNFLWGFLSSGPMKVAPEPLYSMICPTNDTYDPATGELIAAPLGLRRVQGALERAEGPDHVVAQHPFFLDRVIGPDTEVVALSEMSPLGMGPVDTALSWYNTTWNREWFGRMAEQLKRLKERYGFKVVVGGAGAWQFLKLDGEAFSLAQAQMDPDKKAQYGIDHVVEGEADAVAPQLFASIRAGTAPEVIRLFTNSIVEIDDIPEINRPTLTGLVECMRGCGRGCDFCAPNLRTKRDFSPERVAREARVNLRQGYTGVWLQTEELTLYGCQDKDKWPNVEAITDLYAALKRVGAQVIGATHWTFAGCRAAPELIQRLAEFNGLDKGPWMGVQPGLEYASPRLVRRFMPFKVKPYSPEEYPETIREGWKVMNQHHFYPCATLIVGHPGEELDEVQQTIDLVRTLSETDRVHGILAPLLYVDYYRPHQTMDFDRMHPKHWELYYYCWKHNVREFRERVWVASQSFGLLHRMVSIVGTYAIGTFLLRFVKNQFRARFGFVPSWMT